MAYLVGILAQIGFKRRVFQKETVLAAFDVVSGPDGLGPSKNEISMSTPPPKDTIFACSGTSGRHATRLVSHIRVQHYLNPSI